MTYEEAVKLSCIISVADGQCTHCVTELMNLIADEWPAIDWRAAFKEGAPNAEWWEQSDKV
jgi:hypothetical protein